MTNPWPEEESRTSEFGDVFDEALKPRRTGQDDVDDILVWLAVSRFHRIHVPEDVLTCLERVKRIEMGEITFRAILSSESIPRWRVERLARARAAEALLRGQSRCAEDWLKAWLLERHPLRHFVAHWGSCAKCQAAQRNCRG